MNPVNNQVVYPVVNFTSGNPVSTSQAITNSSGSRVSMAYNSGIYTTYSNSGTCSLNYLGNMVCGTSSSVVEINPITGALINTYNITSGPLSVFGGYIPNSTSYYTLNYQYCNLITGACSYLTGRNSQYYNY